MLIYAAFLLAAIAPSLANVSQPRTWTLALRVYFVLLLVFLGFRFEVGPDWRAYEHMHESYFSYSTDEFYRFSEPGFFLLNKICGLSGLGFQGVVFVCALIFLGGCFSYARITSDPWMAVAVVMPYLIYIIAASGIRQSTAIGIGFYVVGRAKEMSLTAKLVAIALAVSFHNSAALLLLFVIVPLNLGLVTRGMMVAVVASFVAIGVDQADAVEKYNAVYLQQNIVSEGAFYHVLLIAFPAALYLIFRKRILAVVPADANVHVAAYMALGSVPLLAVSSTGFDRLSLYLSFVQMWVYPALVEARVAPRFSLVASITAIALATFLVYFIYGSHAPAYVPYHSALFGE